MKSGISGTTIPVCRIVHNPAALRHAAVFRLLARFLDSFMDRNALNFPFLNCLGNFKLVLILDYI
jgi:hypothetical protein